MEAVIVTHNSAAELRAQVASRSTVEAFDRVLVVDNASTDDTREVAADAGLEVVSLEANRGLAAAANVGVARTSGPSFALLNPDVRATSAGDFRRLEEELGEDGIGAVAPALVLPDGTVQDSARWVPTPLDLVVRRISRNERGAVRVTNPVDVEWATAACLVVRRSAFDQIGGFDERYFLYFEDVDLCRRVARTHRTTYFPGTTVVHAWKRASHTAPRYLWYFISSAAKYFLRWGIRIS